MVITKSILKTLDLNGSLDIHSLYMEIDDIRAKERLAFLCERGDIQPVGNNKFMITEQGKRILSKLL